MTSPEVYVEYESLPPHNHRELIIHFSLTQTQVSSVESFVNALREAGWQPNKMTKEKTYYDFVDLGYCQYRLTHPNWESKTRSDILFVTSTILHLWGFDNPCWLKKPENNTQY